MGNIKCKNHPYSLFFWDLPLLERFLLPDNPSPWKISSTKKNNSKPSTSELLSEKMFPSLITWTLNISLLFPSELLPKNSLLFLTLDPPTCGSTPALARASHAGITTLMMPARAQPTQLTEVTSTSPMDQVALVALSPKIPSLSVTLLLQTSNSEKLPQSLEPHSMLLTCLVF